MRTSKALSGKLADILSNATPKEKAILVCKDWTDLKTRSLKPLLTEDEARQIRDSLKTNEEKREYNKWLNYYNVYTDLMTLCGVIYKEYQVQAERVLGYLRVWEDYDQEENNINRIYDQLFADGTDKQKEAFTQTLKTLSFGYGKIVQDKDGYVEITRNRLYETIIDEVKDMSGSYEVAKCFVIAVEEWTKAKRCKAIMPELMEIAIDQIKEDYALRVAPRYSRAELKKHLDRGERVSEMEGKLAVFPSYEETQTPDLYLDMFRRKVKDVEKYGQK